jgi:hypothetical protein
MKSELFIYSRKILKLTLTSWVDLIPVHTFATIGDHWRNEKEINNGVYWYCAGDFYASNDIDVQKVMVSKIFDIEYASCLVLPNIKYWGNVNGHQKVIDGRYAADFVCHNLANRVLSALSPRTTLADYDIDLTGYKLIVGSYLGIYGRDDAEWTQRQQQCKQENQMRKKDEEDELKKIHNKSLKGIANYQDITASLEKVDANYKKQTTDIYTEYRTNKIGDNEFHKLMAIAMINLLNQTESIVGGDITKAIHGFTVTEFTNNLSLNNEVLSK